MESKEPSSNSIVDWILAKCTRQTLRYSIYWILALSFVAWSWTTLYVQSFGNTFGGKDSGPAKAIKEKKEIQDEIVALEKNGAAPSVIFDQKVKLSLQLSQNNDHVTARKILQDEGDALLKLPESEENSGLRVRIEELVGHTYINQGLFVEAATSLKSALTMAEKMQAKYFSENAQLLILTETNELGVVTYLQANGTLDGKTRADLFDRSQKTFEKLLAQIDTLQGDPSKLTDETKKLLAGMRRHVRANLDMVLQDKNHEWEYHKT